MSSSIRVLPRHAGPLLVVLVGAILIFTLPQGRDPAPSPAGFQSSSPPKIDWRAGTRPSRQINNAFGLRRPSVGSPAWRAIYPPQELGPRPLPQWIARYRYLKDLPAEKSPFTAVADVPQAALTSNGQPLYPAEKAVDPGPGGACSFRLAACVRGNEAVAKSLSPDVTYGQSGSWAVNFDDGPLPPSKQLYDFLWDRNEKATHFWVSISFVGPPQTLVLTRICTDWQSGPRLPSTCTGRRPAWSSSRRAHVLASASQHAQ